MGQGFATCRRQCSREGSRTYEDYLDLARYREEVLQAGSSDVYTLRKYGAAWVLLAGSLMSGPWGGRWVSNPDEAEQ